MTRIVLDYQEGQGQDAVLTIPRGPRQGGQTGRSLSYLDTTTRLTAKSVGAYNVVLRYGKVRKLWRGRKKPRMKGR
jgi:hypothetical protein